MQTYIVSFASFLCIGIAVRLFHPETLEISTSNLVIAGFILAAAIISFLYRTRVLAFIFLCAAISVAMLALPIDPELNQYLMAIFAGLFIISIVFGFIKLQGLPFWILSALVLGYGLTCVQLDKTSDSHLVHWSGDTRNDQTLVYGMIVKEPEVRPEKGDTRLIVKPSIVANLRKKEQGLDIINQAINEITNLNREWDTGEEVLSTLLEVRDKLTDNPDADSKKIITEEFSVGDYTPSGKDIEIVELALEELGSADQDEGWISRIDKGWILVTVLDKNLNKEDLYPSISHYSAYGDTVKIIAPLRAPPAASNPGGFDYKEYLSQINTFAMMKIKGKENWTTKNLDTMEIIKPGGGNFFINWVMGFKYKLLAIIRQTTPFPESGFLSGIFIGLRKGVPDKIVKESQAAGTAHVFAVSGLHVSIIAGLLLLIFNQTPIPKSIWAPMAVLFLIIFTILTGARPSTLRACIMTSFVLIFFTYFGEKIAKSLVMSISFAAIVIICFLPPGYGGPLILPSASFLMSFSAVLFLGLLSGPIEEFFNFKLKNLQSLVTIAAIFVWIGLLFMNLGNPLGIFKAKLFWGMLIAIPVAFLIQQVIPFTPRFAKIPGKWLRTFIAAQVAIQCSIVPISMLIFHRISLAAPFANFIAIPMIGIILPLGMLATLMGFIPLIGIYIALVITAANWIGMHFFIGLDAFFTRVFPYPQVPKPGALPLGIFYAIVAFFLFREKIILTLKMVYFRVKNSMPDGGCRIRVYVSLAALLISIVTISTGFVASSIPELKVIYLSMGWNDGMTTLIEAPNGDNILIDGGAESWSFYKKQYRYNNQGQRTVEEVLLSEKIVGFDAVINSSCDARVLGGLNYIVGSNDYYIKQLYSALPPEDFGPQDLDFNRFTLALSVSHRDNPRHTYCNLMLNQFTPEECMEFMTYFRAIPDEDLMDFLKTLPENPRLKFDPRTITEKAIQALNEKEAEAHEKLIESIISTEKWLHPKTDFSLEQAEALAKKWKLPLLPPNDYVGFVCNLPQAVQWFVFQQGGVVSDMDELLAYRMDLVEHFETAIGYEPEDPSEKLYRGDEMFLQYHRLLFAVKVRDIPIQGARQGIEVIPPEKVGGQELRATILNPVGEREKGKYVNEVNSVVVRLQFGEVSFLFPSLIDNQGVVNMTKNVKGGIHATIYMAPQFGKGGKYFDPIQPINRVKPEVAVFQYSGGSFGRESKKFRAAWDYCQEVGIESYNTKEQGAIIIYTDGTDYRVVTALGEEKKAGAQDEKVSQTEEVGVGM
ncbi:MAG: ComEC/Rec2 family competence protein [Candidatus Auribacterota bacterium]|nr:ComEC/Rec2 family competence protein [Candidatus Auribacterota bacterium]